MAEMVKNSPVIWETWVMQVRFLGWEDALEESMATHSCLESPTGRGAWWARAHRVAKSLMWLSMPIKVTKMLSW